MAAVNIPSSASPLVFLALLLSVSVVIPLPSVEATIPLLPLICTIIPSLCPPPPSPPPPPPPPSLSPPPPPPPPPPTPPPTNIGGQIFFPINLTSPVPTPIANATASIQCGNTTIATTVTTGLGVFFFTLNSTQLANFNIITCVLNVTPSPPSNATIPPFPFIQILPGPPIRIVTVPAFPI